ncbi:MAG: spore coat protein U domain-containing protein [Gammaproteobacteria bacterium]|nr:spore coat protein U domain-containing protein [Gammaproteobacteria bacterium]
MLKHLRTLVITGAAVLPLAIAAIPAHAGTTTGTFQVTATVVNSCKINSASNVVFGNYDPTSALNTTAASTISVNCTKGDSYNIALNYGGTGSAANRIMTDGLGDNLNYNLYTDSAWTKVWNSSCGGANNCDTGTGAGPGAGNAQTYTVYGSIAAGQNVPAGSYTDTIQLTVTF